MDAKSKDLGNPNDTTIFGGSDKKDTWLGSWALQCLGLLWMDAKSMKRSTKETTVEIIWFVDIYVEDSNHSRLSKV